jgi:putative ABC transport system ATP-binding protein
MTEVTRRFETRMETVHALRGISLEVARGEFLTITGHSGSGKSTLLHILGLLDQPSSGEYTLAGTRVTDLSDGQRARIRGAEIGFVFQALHLLDRRPCIENVALAGLYQGAAPGYALNAAGQALEAVGMAHKARANPARLSGGERQRVAIARAICMSPSLIVCDEPTGNLDSVNTAAVLDILSELNDRGVTIVLVTHEQDVAARGARTLEVSDGLIAARS